MSDTPVTLTRDTARVLRQIFHRGRRLVLTGASWCYLAMPKTDSTRGAHRICYCKTQIQGNCITSKWYWTHPKSETYSALSMTLVLESIMYNPSGFQWTTDELCFTRLPNLSLQGKSYPYQMGRSFGGKLILPRTSSNQTEYLR